jgi:phosphatidylserine/phosphatidylglycerophosphate/cardiolipin synthase-like enzyme
MIDNKDEEVMILIEDSNAAAAMTSKLKADFVNILPTTPASKEDRLLTLYEFSEKNQNKDCQTEMSDASNEISYRRDKLLKSIKENKKKLNTSLYIISSKYDLIYFRYNRISLLILIV